MDIMQAGMEYISTCHRKYPVLIGFKGQLSKGVLEKIRQVLQENDPVNGKLAEGLLAMENE